MLIIEISMILLEKTDNVRILFSIELIVYEPSNRTVWYCQPLFPDSPSKCHLRRCIQSQLLATYA